MKSKCRVYYLKKAQDDLNNIFDYIKIDNPAGAESFVEKIDKYISRLSSFPLSGIQPKDNRLKNKGYRVVIVDNYLVFYFIKGNNLYISRVIHGKQNYIFLL